MQFKKIGDRTIRCFISQEEMYARGVDIEDLMDDRGKAEDFLREILAEAREEVDFETKGDALNVQLSVLKNGGISLIISDDRNAVMHTMLEQIKEKLKSFQESMEAVGGDFNSPEAVEIPPYSNVTGAVTPQIGQSPEEVVLNAGDDDLLAMEFWASFDSMDQVLRLAKEISVLDDIPSQLYSYEGMYYMHMSFAHTKKQMAHFVFIVSEYSDQIFNGDEEQYIVEEHGEMILGEHALMTLASV